MVVTTDCGVGASWGVCVAKGGGGWGGGGTASQLRQSAIMNLQTRMWKGISIRGSEHKIML